MAPIYELPMADIEKQFEACIDIALQHVEDVGANGILSFDPISDCLVYEDYDPIIPEAD